MKSGYSGNRGWIEPLPEFCTGEPSTALDLSKPFLVAQAAGLRSSDFDIFIAWFDPHANVWRDKSGEKIRRLRMSERWLRVEEHEAVISQVSTRMGKSLRFHPSQDRIAEIFGSASWDEMYARLGNGQRILVGGPLMKDAGADWHALRKDSGLIQVRVGRNWEVGFATNFSETEIADDLKFDQLPAAYDDYRFPVACPRANAGAEGSHALLKAMGREMFLMKASMVAVVVIGLVGAVTLLFHPL